SAYCLTLDFCSLPTRRSSDLDKPGTRFKLANTWTKPEADLDAAGNQLYVDASGNYVDASAPGAIPAQRFPIFETGRGSNPDHYRDRKSTRLNSSHVKMSYAVF